ncbi:MAG: type II secretion system protein [Candidatus Eremiobacteraeota bacterium]|nr:type II secretion system protein [Candidatus Eremiobacteraeota bacterium]MCW5867218.1 type II secretion system protein [Candidatus Eremiobacteraeota bacterium]
MSVKRRRAFTLAEAMVGLFLISIILGVAAEAIRWAVRSHRSGEAKRQAIALGREVLNRISAEMSTSIGMGLLPNGGELRSGVIYPDYSPALNLPFTGNLYKREHVLQTLPGGSTVNVDRAYNRLIFSTPGKRSGVFSDSLADYVFVEYLVPPRADNPDRPQNKLYRRTYRVMSDPLATVIPGLILAGNYEVANGPFFVLDPGDPLGNGNMIDAALTSEQKLQRGLVLELPKPEDQLQFSVEHTAATAQRTTPLPNDPAYQPALYTITVSIMIDSQGNNKYYGSQVLTQQVTIKSGY